MKKFFSILCAIAIVFGVNAAPVSKKDVLAKKTVKKELRYQSVAKKAPAKAVQFKSMDKKVAKAAAPAAPARVSKFTVEGAKTVNAKALKAPQAKKETIDLSFTSADADVSWDDHCADAGWWQITAESDEYYVTLSNADSDEAAGEYAWEDLDPSYCGIWYEACGENMAYFTDGSCTVAVSEEAIVVEGTFECEDGNTYNIDITYEKPEAPVYPEGGEFECDEVSFSYYSSDGDAWYKLVVNDPEMTFRFDVLVGEGLEDVELDKEYTLDDMLANYTYVLLGETKVNFTEVSFLKSSNEDGSADLNVVATDENGNVWKLHYAYPAAPEALSFETITANVTYTKEANWFWYVYTFEAADEANAIVLEIMPDDSFFGTWEAGENADITGAVAPVGGEESEIYSGEVTIEQSEEGFKITGKVLCWNSIEYTLDLTYVIPEATRQAEFALEGLELDVFEGAWQLSGFSEDGKTYASIAAYADEVSGTYTESELAADYCYIYTDLVLDEEGYVVEGSKFELLKANLEVTFNEADSTIVITGTFRGQNGEDIPEFNVTLSGRIPTPEVSDMTFVFADEEDGILVTPSNEEDAWDWYVGDAATLEYYGGAEAFAEAVYENFGTKYAEPGERLVSFEEMGSMLSGDGTYYLLVWGAGENNITTEVFVHEFEYESGLPEGCTQYDAQEESFEHDFASYTLDESYVAQYSVLFIEAQDAQNNYISLELKASAVVPGVYNVGEEISAGELDLNQGNIYGSFAGELTAQGISVPLWLLIEGTVTVNEDLSIDVDAVNCAGVAIKCHLASAAEGIENVILTEDIKKVVVDGVLYIVRDGKMFNVQGAQVR